MSFSFMSLGSLPALTAALRIIIMPQGILGQAMGFEYPDRVKTFKLYEDMDRVLAEAGEMLRANGIDPDEARSHLQKAVYS